MPGSQPSFPGAALISQGPRLRNFPEAPRPVSSPVRRAVLGCGSSTQEALKHPLWAGLVLAFVLVKPGVSMAGCPVGPPVCVLLVAGELSPT